jgi:hypothetical protein
MKEREALSLVARMFAAHGMKKPPEVVAILAEEALHSSCGSCAKSVLEMGMGGAKPLTVQMYRDAYLREFGSPNHGLHVGQDEHVEDIGKAEAERRTVDVRALVDAGMEPQRAQVAAAMRWANRFEVGVDLDVEAWTRQTPKTIKERTITAAWDYARACATKEPGLMSDDEWRSIVGPWEKAWREAQV